jgi:hypothetical protein
MKLVRILRPPIGIGWWLGAVAAGLAVPTAFTVLIILGGYYPIGSWLPASDLLTPWGIVLAIGAIAAGVILAGPAYALLAWSWRPVALAVLFELCLFLGLAPARITGDLMLRIAFDLLESRNSELINAIETYERERGAPPATLTQLVPDYLPSIPQTGVAVAPYYEYETNPALCSVSKERPSDWHLSVSVGGFLIVHQLFYCPGIGSWLYEQSDGR